MSSKESLETARDHLAISACNLELAELLLGRTTRDYAIHNLQFRVKVILKSVQNVRDAVGRLTNETIKVEKDTGK